MEKRRPTKRRSKGRSKKSERAIEPYAQESLLIDAVSEMAGERIVCTSAGLAQLAIAAATAFPKAKVCCTYFDLYRSNLAYYHWPHLPANLRIECAADLPNENVDVVAFPFSATGDAELTRELIQAAHQRLHIGGRLFAATDNADDTWLQEQLGRIFKKLESRAYRTGALYVATKSEPLKKQKNFGCEFAFRDAGRLIRACSRPGVFSHRRIDPGARQLMNEMQIEPSMRVLDIGCGSGVVSLAAACRAENVTVHAVDSNARAVQCNESGAALNGLTNVTTELNAEGRFLGAPFDLALANPPYYSSFRIARHFLIAGREALRPGGQILLVTRRADWYLEHMPEWYENVSARERKGYYIVKGTCPVPSVPRTAR
jgi:16S rRNA (guanine1207-N2)-methyltransferase